MTTDLPKNRKLAVAAGVKKFFTGEPCKHGHVAYRYTQSGTCSACIRASVDAVSEALRSDKPDPSVARAARRAALEQLVEIQVRSRPEAVAAIRALAGSLVTMRFPELNNNDAWSNKSGTNPAGGTLLYKMYVHSDDIQFIRTEAQKTMNPVPVDIAAERRRIFGKAAMEADAKLEPEPPFVP